MTLHGPSEELPAFLLSSAEVYNTCRLSVESKHGKPLVDFATRWAQIMQRDMAGGSLADVWMSAYNKADIEAHGVTRNHFPIVVWFLVKCWKHGEELWPLYKTYEGLDNGAHSHSS